MKLKPNQPIAILAQIETGAFSGERLCTVILANGENYSDIVPAHFCWNLDGEPLTEQTVEAQPGLIAAKFIEFVESPKDVDYDQLIVSVLDVFGDTQIIAVGRSIARPRPLCPVLNKND